MEEDHELDIEPFRSRSMTWPSVIQSGASGFSPGCDPEPGSGDSDQTSPIQGPGDQFNQVSPGKKNTSRRNAWGNMSYADLITQAISQAPENRLTLSQIYEWMVQNVPYFKDKGDSNSSAGWKNSIRHNLSLHNRFMRVQNEGTGKSSWWMINPDAKPGKAARRRAASMETSKFEKKRGRIKKKLEAIRNGTIASPGSSVSEGLDVLSGSPLHQGFQLSPDFRPRASSNASSYGGGRLSPILAVESDMLLLSLSNGNGLAESENCIADTRGPMLSQPLTNGVSISNVLPHHTHGLPNDLDLDSLEGGLECDVNSVIQHELRLEGDLDFNFDSSSLQANQSAASVATSLASNPNLNWYTELYIQ